MLADRRAASVSNEGLFIAQIGSLLQEVWRRVPRFVVSLHRSRGFAIRGQEQPVEEGLLEEPHHHLYSSFKDEAEMPGMANLDSIWGEVMAEPVPPLQGHQSTTNELGQ